MSAYAVDAVVVQRETARGRPRRFTSASSRPPSAAAPRVDEHQPRTPRCHGRRAKRTKAFRGRRGNDVRVELDGEGMITCECVRRDDGWCRFAGGTAVGRELSWPLNRAATTHVHERF